MITIRTLFSAVLGYVIENISHGTNKIEDKEEIDSRKDKEIEESELIEESAEEKCALETRVVIIGHLLMAIVITLIVGVFLNSNQSNQSLVLLKNTAFSCVGFLISAAKTHTQSK